jgi:hypothetical protein
MILARYTDADITDLARLFDEACRPLPTAAQALEIARAEMIVCIGIRDMWRANHVGHSNRDRPSLQRGCRFPSDLAPVAGLSSGQTTTELSAGDIRTE